jgi:hypothetical protein
MHHPTSSNSLRPPDDAPDPADYESDFSLWIERQVELLREKKFEQLDLEHVIEELNDMAGSLRRELKSRLRILIMHLLKCEFQPQRKSGSWLGTLAEQRDEIEGIIEESPSLARHIRQFADQAYRPARRRAALETGLPLASFPAASPYSKDQLLDSDFVP